MVVLHNKLRCSGELGFGVRADTPYQSASAFHTVDQVDCLARPDHSCIVVGLLHSRPIPVALGNQGDCQIASTPSEFNRTGSVTAPVVGGNLSLLVDALNTPSEPDTDGKILIVEEVDEYFYKLDRMLTQLRRTGKLKKLAGLVVGHMTDIKNSDLDFGETTHDIINHAVRDYQYPVAFSFPSGHHEPNEAWVQGATATLEVSLNNVSLSYPNIYSANE